MSNIYKRWSKFAAVLVSGALLAASAFVTTFAPPGLPAPVPAQDVAAVIRARAVLQSAKTPITGMSWCDALVAMFPDKVDPNEVVKGAKGLGDNDVIVCFRGGIDYGEALKAAEQHGLTWSRGLDGDKVMVFARDEAGFLAAAKANGLKLDPSELTSTLIGQLQNHPNRARSEGGAWRIKADPVADEALYGPYLILTPGAYRLSAVFEPADRGADCAALAARLIVSVQVTVDRRQRDLSPRQVLVFRRLGSSGCRLQGQLDFAVPPGPNRTIETPFWVVSPSDVLMADYEINAQPTQR